MSEHSLTSYGRAGVARVLLLGQGLELRPQLGLAAVGGGRGEPVHRRAAVVAELADQLRASLGRSAQ